MESCTGDTTMSAWSGIFPVYTCTWAVVAGCTSGVIRLTLVAKELLGNQYSLYLPQHSFGMIKKFFFIFFTPYHEQCLLAQLYIFSIAF